MGLLHVGLEDCTLFIETVSMDFETYAYLLNSDNLSKCALWKVWCAEFNVF